MRTWPFAETQKPAPAEPVVLQPGNGTRLTVSALGSIVSVPSKGAKYPHPFKPRLNGSNEGVKVSLSRGLVEFIEPKIGKVLISGGENSAPPLLRLDFEKANVHGESWVCVEVEPNEKGLLDEKSRVEIVHSNAPVSLDEKIGRTPLAMIIWKDRKPFQALEIAYFNLRYVRMLPPPGQGAVRHLFF